MKKYLLAFSAVILVIALVAFNTTKTPKKTRMTSTWELNAPGDDPSVATNYTVVSGSGPSCNGSDVICTIVDEANSEHPSQPALEFGNPFTHQADYSAVLQINPGK
jgi:hypothetical protein